MPSTPLIAVDVGNARIKLGSFRAPRGDGLPEPEQTLHIDGRSGEPDRLAAWLDDLLKDPAAAALGATAGLSSSAGNTVGQANRGTRPFGSVGPIAWYIGSVNRPATSRLIDWVREHRPADRIVMLAADDLPLTVKLQRPDMVGVDRLLDAIAANRLRSAGCPAVVVDVGSAITVDLVSADGVFLGGAILPGIAMSARALHEFTDLLPLIDMADLAAPPPAVGQETIAAMRAGLFWGAVGSVRQLVEEMTRGEASDQPPPQVYLTGGAAPAVADLLGPAAVYVPHLTLAGIALAADHLNGLS